MARVELWATPHWSRTGNPYFPVAACVDGIWWVLRLNSFPDHPLWTLFVGGECRFDLEDTPAVWGVVLGDDLPTLPASTAAAVLAPVKELVAYGSEVGEPCDDPYCCG